VRIAPGAVFSAPSGLRDAVQARFGDCAALRFDELANPR
jgi:hypothetical protein